MVNIDLVPVKTNNTLKQQHDKIDEEYAEYKEKRDKGLKWQDEATDTLQAIVTALNMTDEGLHYWLYLHNCKMIDRNYEDRRINNTK